jgi:GH25 family lysozyme M1 (1,4-beta-N-acetylmuramidase)
VTIYLPDVSAFQSGVNLAGAQAVAIKATQGTTYISPAYGSQAASADAHSVFRLAYHFLEHGNGGGEADHFFGTAGKTPAMVDCEPTFDSHGNLVTKPTVADVCAFVDRLRARGGIVYWVYLPRWWWEALGSPDLAPLRQRGLLIWSSAYTTYSDSSSAVGWQGYGGMVPLVWQYSESTPFGGLGAVDFSAFRGSSFAGKQDPASVAACRAEFISLSRTGKAAPAPAPTILPPVQALVVTAIGPSSVRLQWDNPGPSPFAVGTYQVTIRYADGPQAGQDLPSYGRTGIPKAPNPVNLLFGSLPAKTRLRGLVRAVATTGKNGSEWAQVEFTTTAAKVVAGEVLDS